MTLSIWKSRSAEKNFLEAELASLPAERVVTRLTRHCHSQNYILFINLGSLGY